MLDATLQLLCSRKPGTLSRLLRELGQFGLQYRSHQIAEAGDQLRITILAGGELKGTPDELAAMLREFDEVVALENLKLERNGKSVSEFRNRRTQLRIAADEALTPAVLAAAEQRLSEILGPAASFVVETCARESRNAGELFTRLADEVSDTGERNFLLGALDRKI